MKVRTYGISQEYATQITNHVFADLYLRATQAVADEPEFDRIIKTLTEHPEACRMIIISTLVFAIGNFDRIDKIERWATLTEDGDIDDESLEILDPKFVV